MEKILSESDSQHLLTKLSDGDKQEIERDKVRFGEYFIAEDNQRCFRVNPINVVSEGGNFRLIKFSAETLI